MTNAATIQNAVSMTFAHPSLMYGDRLIRYGFVNDKHVVSVTYPAGEDIAPNYYRFDNIIEARNLWRKITADWKAAGFVVGDYWDMLKRGVA